MDETKKILYVDMDGVLVNFQSGIDKLTEEELLMYKDQEKNAPHIFSKMDPIEGAIDAYLQFADMTEAERVLYRQALLRYCELDTMAMVMIWEYWMMLLGER